LKVKTVLGEIDSLDLGITLPHEHLLINAWADILIKNLGKEFAEITKGRLFNQKVGISNLGDLKISCTAIYDNLVLDNKNIAIEEVKKFKMYGGNTIVDLTNKYMGRNVIALKKISENTGINIITCTGFYIEFNHPDYIKEKKVEELADIMVKELNEGIENTNICAGIIGEIGLSRKISANEEKVLEASAIAQQKTGVALYIHTWPFGSEGISALNILEKTGINFEKIVIGHVDGKIDISYYLELLERGVYIGFENFGKEYREESDNEIFIVPNDLEKIKAIQKLIELKQKYLNKILISTDRCLKMELVKYGGFGYGHILKNIVPMMKKIGFTQKQIDTILVENTKKILEIIL